MIDNATRFSAASVVKSKKKEVELVIKHWIAISGTPDKIMNCL